jgi:thiol-disulfide isomerase/thioredoxin
MSVLFALSKFPTTGNVVLNPGTNLDDNPDKVVIYFFWGDGCPHCEAQKPYLEQFQNKYPEVEIKAFETWKNNENKQVFQQVADAYGIQIQGVPTTFIGERHWVGFSTTMASDMESYIQQLISEGEWQNPGDKLK